MYLLKRSFFAVLVLTLCVEMAAAQFAERWERQGWKTDFSKSNVEYSEIMSGGPPKDGIPPLDNPIFVNVANSDTLAETEPVIGLEINGDARAYPLSVLMWHEIANDTVGGKPVAVTFCPLCNAAIVFDATVDGKVLTFGTTGKLRKSDLVMYDRTTESWWQQFSGTGIAGHYTDKELKLIPARLEPWGNFSKRHPDGKVLVPNNPNMRNYGANPYPGYDTAARPFLYNGAMPEGISPMARVVVVRRAGEKPIIVSMDKVRKAKELEMEGYFITWSAGQNSALDQSSIRNGRDVGSVGVEKQEGNERVLAAFDVTFAFVAHAFHPDVAIVKN